GGREEGGVRAGGEGGHAEARGAPAVVAERALERPGAAHVADEADLRRVEAGVDGDRLVLLGGEHRLDAEMLDEDLLATLVNVAHGGADRGVLVGDDLLGEKIDEAALALEEREELERAGRRIDLLLRRLGFLHRLRQRFRRLLRLQPPRRGPEGPGRHRAAERNPKEAKKRQGKTQEWPRQ